MTDVIAAGATPSSSIVVLSLPRNEDGVVLLLLSGVGAGIGAGVGAGLLMPCVDAGVVVLVVANIAAPAASWMSNG